MSKRVFDRIRYLAASCLATAGLCLALPLAAQAAPGDLVLDSITGDMVTGSASSGYTVYVRDGDIVEVDLNVRNATSEQIDYVNVTQTPTIGTGDDAWEPIEFPHPKTTKTDPPVANTWYDGHRWYTSETSEYEFTYSEYNGFSIEAGVTATFTLRIGAGDLSAGTYDWNLQLGRIQKDYESRIVVIDPTLSYPETFFLGQQTVDTYINVPIRVVVYQQANASIAAGVNVGTSFTPELDTNPIDFGTIDLSNTDESVFLDARTVTVMNTRTAHASDRVANVTDAHGNTANVSVSFGGESFLNGEPDIWGYSPFGYGNLYGDYSFYLYDINWNPLEPSTSTSFSYADYSVVMNAAYSIAGTYTGNLLVYTAPHTLKVNGQANDGTGVYRIPITVTLTGTNPRLLPRVTDLTATPGNGLVELSWTPAEDSTQYTEYTIYRREGTETQTDPDKINWGLYEAIGTKAVGYNDTLLYIDGTVENGTTYSYTVISGSPYHGYAAQAKSAKPLASIQSRMLAPDSNAYGYANYVAVSWEMNDEYGGTASDGSGMVDHFNIYRDGVLVDVIYRSAVEDDVQLGWHDDGTGTGTQIYGPMGHSYSWSVEEPVPELYQPYRWTVSAVSPSGIESYLDEESEAFAYSDNPVIAGHSAYYDSLYYVSGNDDFDDVPAIAMYIDTSQENPERYTFWRSVGTTAPNTNQAPYATVDFESHPDYGGMYVNGMYMDVTFADKNVQANKTYTYTVRTMDGDGNESDAYTFTVKTVEDADFATPSVTWTVVSGTTARMQFYVPEGTTANVYRNGSKVKTYSGDTNADYQDNPGGDGTYTYRVDYTTSGITTQGRTYTFVRNTKPVDTSSLLKPPDAPTLSARTAGDRHIILSWTPAATGGTPEGYHIYRSDGGRALTGGRYVTTWHWNGPTEDYEKWGNGRYISLAGGDTLMMVDGESGNYLGDPHLGQTESLSWDDYYMPHVYYITAYNRAGESAPSQVITFDTYDEDDYGNRIAPMNPVSDLPDAPTIKRTWIDWDDQSSYKYGFDDWVYGNIRVAWEDSGLGGDIDSWTATFAGLHWEDNGLNSPRTDNLEYHQALLNPANKLGTAEDAPTYMVDGFVQNGDLGRTLTVTVAAENAMGSSTSEPVYLDVLSVPRFYALPTAGGAVLRWTDLADDTDTQVTSWEIWRKAEYGLWEQVAILPGTTAYAGVGKTYNKQDVNYYEWADSGLDNGWAYSYKVVAKCNGPDHPSVVREVTPEATATVEAPGKPLNFSAQVRNGIVYMSWDAPNTGGAVGNYQPLYENLRYDNTMWWDSAGSTCGASTTTAMWMPDQPGTYRLCVYSYNYVDDVVVPAYPSFWTIEGWDDMNGDQRLEAEHPSHSNVVEVTITQADIDSRPSGYLGDFSLTLTPSDGQVTLSWTASENARCFEIDRINNDYPDMPDVVVPAVLGQQTYTYVDETAEPGVKYRYVVTARGSGGGLYRDGYARATGQTRDQQIAAQVSELIQDLPAPSAVSVDDAEQILGVQEVWETLTDKQRELVGQTLATKLADDVAAVEELALLAKYSELVAPVQALIDALPDAGAVTVDDADQIAAARAAYNALTPAEAKRLVKTAKLVAAEEALAAAIKYEADLAVAQPVMDAIDALPNAAALALSDRTAVEAARAAYDALTADQKAIVGSTRADKLAADEARLVVLQKEADDRAAAAPVTAAIEALPGPDALALSDRAAVEAARAAYDALTDDQKAYVPSADVEKLSADEARLVVLQKEADDRAAAAPVSAAIDALPPVADVALTDASNVAVARGAYDALTDDQKAYVGDERAAKLAALEQRIAELKAELAELEDAQAAAAVDALIEQIGEVTLDRAVYVETAREMYDSLSDGAKELVENLPTLTAAETRLAELQTAAADAAAVDAAIDAIGTVTLSSGPAIEAARSAYDALGGEAKGMVTKLGVLEAAEVRLAQLVQEKEDADRAAAAAVVEKIDALPSADAVTSANEAAVAAAESALAALTADQRAYVPQAKIDKLAALRAALEKRQVIRIAGDYANETSAKISAEAFGKSDWIVLARDDDFADALGATGVAGALDCPIVLTDRTELSAAAASEIKRLGATKCYIIGGTGAMKLELEGGLRGCGITYIERLWGDNSYDTSLACARKIVELGGKSDEAIIAMSTNFQDALSMSSYAYKFKVPVVLQTWGTYASDRGFTSEAQSWLSGKKLIVAGGAGAISNESVQPYTVTARLWGDSGYDTSQAIAEWMVGKGYLSPDTVVLACGAQAPKGTDALAGAALAGKNSAPVLLVNTNEAMEGANTTTVDGFLAANKAQVRKAYILGGAYVMPQALYDRVAAIIGA